MENFNNLYDVEKLKKSLDEAQENSTPEFKDVPVGTYDTKLEKCELVASSTNKPMCKIQFRIIAGEYENQCLFYNKVLIGVNKETGELSAMPLHFNNEFLKSMKVFADDEIVFNDFNDYANLLSDIADECKTNGYGFKVEYSKRGDFAEYKIKERFNLPF